MTGAEFVCLIMAAIFAIAFLSEALAHSKSVDRETEMQAELQQSHQRIRACEAHIKALTAEHPSAKIVHLPRRTV